MLVGATFVGVDVAEWLHAATIAVIGEVPLAAPGARRALLPDAQRGLAEPARKRHRLGLPLVARTIQRGPQCRRMSSRIESLRFRGGTTASSSPAASHARPRSRDRQSPQPAPRVLLRRADRPRGGLAEGSPRARPRLQRRLWSLQALEAGADFVLGVDAEQMHVDQANLVFEAKGADPAAIASRRATCSITTGRGLRHRPLPRPDGSRCQAGRAVRADGRDGRRDDRRSTRKSRALASACSRSTASTTPTRSSTTGSC